MTLGRRGANLKHYQRLLWSDFKPLDKTKNRALDAKFKVHSQQKQGFGPSNKTRDQPLKARVLGSCLYSPATDRREGGWGVSGLDGAGGETPFKQRWKQKG